jgi:hypothetical protein
MYPLSAVISQGQASWSYLRDVGPQNDAFDAFAHELVGSKPAIWNLFGHECCARP